MKRKKPTSWDGVSRMCTSPYPVRKDECLGEIDFGHGIQYEIKGQERQRYCIPCNTQKHADEDKDLPEKPTEEKPVTGT